MAGAQSDEDLHLGALSKRQPALCRRLQKYSFVAVADIVSGLLTRPENHAAALRIEALIHLAALHCAGRQAPTLAQVRDFLNTVLAKDSLGQHEDPVEDVFVTNTPSGDGNTRIFEGAWEDSGGFLLDAMAALLRLQDQAWARRALDEVMGLTRLSEAAAERAGVARYTAGGGLPHRPVPVTARTVQAGREAVVFTVHELAELGIGPAHIRPFVFNPALAAQLEGERLGHTLLERRPLIGDRDRVILTLPTAVSAAARRHVLEAAQAAGALAEFTAALEDAQLQDLRLSMRGLGVSVAGPPRTLAPGVVALVGTFDDGAYAAAVLVSDDLSETLEEGLQGVAVLLGALDEPIGALEAELAAADDYRRGLTLTVRGGLGRGYVLGFDDPPPGWRRVDLRVGDLLRQSWDHGFAALRIWKVRAQEAAIGEKGYELVNMSSFLNLYSYLELSRFNLVPADIASPGMVTLAPDYVAPLRIRVRQTLDQHLAMSPDRRRWVEVQRQGTDVFFEEVRHAPRYVSPLDVVNGTLLGCVETATRPWWVQVSEDESSPEARGFVYRVWDGALNWLLRLAPRLEAELPGLPPVPISIRLSFPGAADWQTESQAILAGPKGRPGVRVEAGEIVVASDVSARRAYSSPVNVAERWLIAALALGAAELAGTPREEAWADAVAAEVTGSDAARYVHAIPATTIQEMIQSTVRLPPARTVTDEDLAWSRLGLASLAGRSEAGPVPESEAGGLLRTAVLRLWERIRAHLEELDRRSLVEHALLNHEAIEKDRAEWRQTAAALLALHKDQADVIRAHNEREGRRAAAGTSSRALAEMAICTCPLEGGRPCTGADLDILMADLTNMLECAGQCDAHHYGLAVTPLEVTRNGSLEFDMGFMELLHRPYLHALQERAFRDGAEDYADAFEAAEEVSDEDEPEAPGDAATPEGFLAAMRAEYGMSPRDLIGLAYEIAQPTLQEGEPIQLLRKSEVLARLLGGEREGPVDAEAAYAALTLRPRERWDEPHPQGALARDWQPWRMNRKLSLLRRPMVQIDEAEDPLVVVSPGLLDRAVRRTFNAVDGGLPAEAFDSRAMERWIGKAVDEHGHAFNHDVAAEMKRLGFEARADVQLTELGGSKALGDFDVLAWSGETGEVWLIECKRLQLDRTVGEIGERLADYTTRGKRNNKRTPIQKHLDRIDYAKDHPEAVARVTGLPVSALKLRSALVTDALVPMQFTTRMQGLVDLAVDYRGLKARFGRSG